MRDTLKLLRIPFSIFLMPVFLFALSQSDVIEWHNTICIFIALHLFVYPASNAYNSYMDKDETSIGGIENPPKATPLLFYTSVVFDILGIALGTSIDIEIGMLIIVYITASRLYSYRGVRLKKFPIIGFATVFIFQGIFTYYLSQTAISSLNLVKILPALASSFLIGGIYPLTQIYQHKADKDDGVKTISMLLGYKGTFIFTIIMFAVANSLLYVYFLQQQKLIQFVILSCFLLPTLCYFFYWLQLVWRDSLHANFKHTMRLNILASISMNIAFVALMIIDKTL